MTEKTKNYFEELNEINVSDKIEKKNGLSYLSWAFAWQELKKRYPAAKKNVVKSSEGCLYHTDGRTCWVEVSVTINEIEETEYLPVMDFKNQAIPLERITSTAVNTALQRAITKAIARHGLGLYIYAGEDLPEGEEVKNKSGLSANGELANADDLKETLAKKNEDDFKGLKAIIEACGGEEELKEVWTSKENTKILNSLKKWRPELYKMLKEAKDAMKESFKGGQ